MPSRQHYFVVYAETDDTGRTFWTVDHEGVTHLPGAAYDLTTEQWIPFAVAEELPDEVYNDLASRLASTPTTEEQRAHYPVALPDGQDAEASFVLTNEGLIVDVFTKEQHVNTFAATAQEFVDKAVL